MMNKSRQDLHPQESSLRSVLLAFLVLFLHVILIVGLGSFMLLFGGVVAYLPWILAIGGILAAGSTYLWWKHMKRRGKKLRDILKDPVLQGRTVEVSFLGGFASIKLGQSHEPLAIGQGRSDTAKQIEGPSGDHSKQLAHLGRLLKQDVITIDEFLTAKRELMGQ
jgi:fatty-acid desaturase